MQLVPLAALMHDQGLRDVCCTMGLSYNNAALACGQLHNDCDVNVFLSIIGRSKQPCKERDEVLESLAVAAGAVQNQSGTLFIHWQAVTDVIDCHKLTIPIYMIMKT
jgi:hypothetical protein